MSCVMAAQYSGGNLAAIKLRGYAQTRCGDVCTTCSKIFKYHSACLRGSSLLQPMAHHRVSHQVEDRASVSVFRVAKRFE